MEQAGDFNDRSRDLTDYGLGGIRAWQFDDAIRVIEEASRLGKNLLGIDIYEEKENEVRLVLRRSWDESSIGRIRFWRNEAPLVRAKQGLRFLATAKHDFSNRKALIVLTYSHPVEGKM
jgi:hypothetical protein